MDILRSIGGIQLFPVISLVLFVGVFTSIVLWAWRADRRRLDAIAALPLDEPTASGEQV